MQHAQTVQGILLVATAGIVVIGAVSALGGQAPRSAKPPAFEVASVKPNRSGNLSMSLRSPGGGRLTVTNFPLDRVIRWAYRLQGFQLVGAGGTSSDRFDIVAKAEDNPPPKAAGRGSIS